MNKWRGVVKFANCCLVCGGIVCLLILEEGRWFCFHFIPFLVDEERSKVAVAAAAVVVFHGFEKLLVHYLVCIW